MRRQCHVITFSDSFLTTTSGDGMIASHVKHGIAITFFTPMSSAALRRGHHLSRSWASFLTVPPLSVAASQSPTGAAEQGLAEESCWPWGAGWLVAGWVAGRTRLRECWGQWQHLSWLLWLLAREPCDSLVKRVLSTMRHFFFPLRLYLLFSELERKQNVPTKLSTLKLYCSLVWLRVRNSRGMKRKGNISESDLLCWGLKERRILLDGELRCCTAQWARSKGRGLNLFPTAVGYS